MRRYAIYYAPRQGEPLARFARAWLGRDPEANVSCPRIESSEITPQRLAEITSDPAHYGFHGTLKPPFRLDKGMTEADFLSQVLVFAADYKPIQIERMRLKKIGSFLALVPGERSDELNDLAADCVRSFDHYRRPLTEKDLESRRAAGLSKRQDKLLVKWGYPYVLDQFRFHLTLTGLLDKPERKVVRRLLNELTGPLCDQPLLVRDLTVFVQEDRSASFHILARFPLSGAW
jgi:putative phosphonate metabolism protein